MKTEFPLFDMDKVIRSAGADRVGEDASRKLSSLLADQAREVLWRARIYSRHAGRKTITRDDILLAARTMNLASNKERLESQ
ncbi:MAG TPA: histone [Candidatus Norongarragalinales archaeon]|jgi:histone H3/H4|nr:histone [Candidatus Norongarragalinales archaeon]